MINIRVHGSNVIIDEMTLEYKATFVFEKMFNVQWRAIPKILSVGFNKSYVV